VQILDQLYKHLVKTLEEDCPDSTVFEQVINELFDLVLGQRNNDEKINENQADSGFLSLSVQPLK
jgi:hypothetical protein